MKGIILHHSLVSRDKNNNQFEAIKNYHKEKGWGDKTGYHYLIEPNGEVKKGRDESELGAHTIGYNDMIGICLAGNFDEEEPTKEQEDSLVNLIREIKNRYGDVKIYPHNQFSTYKSCPGKNAMYLIPELNVEIGFEMLSSQQKTAKLEWQNKIKKSIKKKL